MNNLAPVFDFLSELKQNNTRPWFEDHRSEYQLAKELFEDLVNQIIGEFRSIEDLGGVTAKDCVMRIFRDVRFSKDKSPYRSSMAASITAGGRKSERMGYYLHFEPHNNSMIASGLYNPLPEQITRFREAMAHNPAPFKGIIGDPAFKQVFGDLRGDMLKTAPRGFDPNDPEIELLRRKQVLAIHALSDEAALADGLVNQVVQTFKVLKPFVDYLNAV